MLFREGGGRGAPQQLGAAGQPGRNKRLPRPDTFADQRAELQGVGGTWTGKEPPLGRGVAGRVGGGGSLGFRVLEPLLAGPCGMALCWERPLLLLALT